MSTRSYTFITVWFSRCSVGRSLKRINKVDDCSSWSRSSQMKHLLRVKNNYIFILHNGIKIRRLQSTRASVSLQSQLFILFPGEFCKLKEKNVQIIMLELFS